MTDISGVKQLCTQSKSVKEGIQTESLAINANLKEEGSENPADKSTKKKRKKRYTKNSFGRPHKKKKFSSNKTSENGHESDPSNKVKQKNPRKDNRDDNKAAPPHNGSFASQSMRELHGVTIDNFTSYDCTTDADSDNDDSGQTKNAKKKTVLFVGFLGTNYAGMQINQNIKSLQAYIELALFRANYISKSNFGYPSKYSWSNSARTDKGVHSCAQVCSTKLTVPIMENHNAVTPSQQKVTDADWDAVRENINQHLPFDIRILDVVRVTKKFCAKSQRNKVRYQYMVPSFVLQHHEKIRKLFQSVGLDHPKEKNRETYMNPFTPEQLEALQPLVSTYRATPEDLDRLKRALESFQGTHLFHNYTNGKTGSDASARRYILDFSIMNESTLMIDPESGMEWIPIWITGQSFLLHQIRKMMTVVIDVTRQMANMEVLENSLSKKTQMLLTIAPAQGLFLDMSYFDSYNRKKEVQSNTFDRLDWHSKSTDQDDSGHSAAIKRWKKFKEDVVMTHIMREEQKEGNFLKYIYWQEFVVDRSRYWPKPKENIAGGEIGDMECNTESLIAATKNNV